MVKNDEKAKLKKVSAFKPFRVFVRTVVVLILRRIYRCNAQSREIFDQISPPYVLLPNHMTFWDPFYIGGLVKKSTLHYLVSDDHFRNPGKRLALRLLGSIPKTKGRPDRKAIINIARVVQLGDSIGIFPEGARSWDGHTLPLLYATAKLLRMLRIPVIIAIQQGGFLSRPRWTKNNRRGRIDVSFSLGFTPEELSSLSTDQIFEKMTRLLAYDEYSWQREHMVPFKGKRRAENVELVLFLCPQCHAIGNLKSEGNDLNCRCGYKVFYNEYGFFEKRSDTFHHDTLYDWNQWQLGFLHDLLQSRLEQESTEAVFADEGIDLLTGSKHSPLRHLRSGSASLYNDHIDFQTPDLEPLIFKLQEVDGINVQDNERLEFYVDETLYRFVCEDRSTSAFKWMNAVIQLQQLQGLKPQQKAP